MRLAPLALFVFNRPEHTRRTVEALAANEFAADSELFVFADGPRTGSTIDELKRIEAVRAYVSSITGFRKVHLIFAEKNLGLSASITKGIDSVFKAHDRIIVFEDDIVSHPKFLRFCNDALANFEQAENAFAISGFSFPIGKRLPPTYFLRTGAVWGWACWKRSWNHFTLDSGKLLHEITSKGRTREFNFDGNYDFLTMLQKHHEGSISSWDVCWYASIFVANGLTYYPNQSLTVNIGMDGSGTHYSSAQNANTKPAEMHLSDEAINQILSHPPEAKQNLQARRALTRYFVRFEKGGVRNRIRHLTRKYLKFNS